MIRLYLFCLGLFLFCFQTLEALDLQKPEWSQLTFNYSPDEVDTLKQMPRPQTRITSEQLAQLIKEVAYLLNTTDLTEIDETIIPPYLANAQKDFAYLSYLLTGELTGDLGPVTLWTLQLFIPTATLPSFKESSFDVYTSSLASLVVGKAAIRLNEERKQLADYSIRNGEGLWKPTSPGYTGLNFGSAKTWYLTSSKEHLVETPSKNTSFWKDECEMIKNEQENLNGEKVHAVFEWAGLTSIDAGSWEKILNDYLIEKNLPVIPQLYIRALFLSALADSNAVSFNSKYTYWVMRPSQRDPEVKPLIVIPNHPSYPSAHSTISATAATLLTEIFPEDSKKWNSLAEEAGMSRIWGGIHYPIDHKAGLKLGKQVGETVLQRS